MKCSSNSNQKALPFSWSNRTALLHLSIADYAYVMENGRIVMDGPADKLADNEDIKEFYLGVTASGERKKVIVKSNIIAAARGGWDRERNEDE